MGRALSIDPVADLKARLGRESTAQAQAFWTRFLKKRDPTSSPTFHGVPMQKLKTCVRAWWSDHGLDVHPATVGKRVAIALIEQPMIEEKLAGVMILQDIGSHLRATDLPVFARLFAAGHLAEWNVVDWFIMKVLVTLLDRPQGRREVVRAIAQWRTADTVWQRRAACLAFVKLAPQGDRAVAGLTDTVISICSHLQRSRELTHPCS